MRRHLHQHGQDLRQVRPDFLLNRRYVRAFFDDQVNIGLGHFVTHPDLHPARRIYHRLIEPYELRRIIPVRHTDEHRRLPELLAAAPDLLEHFPVHRPQMIQQWPQLDQAALLLGLNGPT